MRVAFVVAPHTGTAKEIATSRSRRINPHFDLPVLAQREVPSTEGWIKISQVVYNVPAAEGRSVFAIVGHWRPLPISRLRCQISETGDLVLDTGQEKHAFHKRSF
jgi:hypothetical protein